MQIVQSTWVRFWHFDLARELHRQGYLKRIFTSLPWWKAEKESKEQGIPRDLISCNFLLQGIRHVGKQVPGYSNSIDTRLGIMQTKSFSRWVANNLPDCDLYIGISGSGLHAGRIAKSRGAAYIMDRGSTQIRHADNVLREEHLKWKMPWQALHPWYIENEEVEASEADIINVPSHFVKQTFVEYGTPADKIRVIPYGVAVEEFYPVGTPPENMFRLVFVGQFGVRKGAPYLLQAFKSFNHPNKELIIVGHVEEEMQTLLDGVNDDKIKFVGVVPRSEVKKYLSTAHALVLPSIEEGLALVQAQAMACGCPVIATPNTGSETLFTHLHEGLIIRAQSAASLTDAFTFLSDNPGKRQDMSNSCLERIRQLGGWKNYGNGVIAVAHEVSGRRSTVDGRPKKFNNDSRVQRLSTL